MASRSQSAKPRGDAPERTLRVLLVDDDQELLSSLSQALARLGVEVITAVTAAEALAMIADPSIAFDVLVVDMVLPDSWGSQVAMERTLYRPGVPVIYISGYSRGDAVFAATTGASDVAFLEKPFTPQELVAAIRRAVIGE